MKRGLLVAVALFVSLIFTSLAFAQLKPILNVRGLGKVEADLGTMELVFTAFRPGVVPMEYSILAGAIYTQSEAGGFALPEFLPPVKREPLPHYVTFIVTINRYEKIGSAVCRENDGRLGVRVIR